MNQKVLNTILSNIWALHPREINARKAELNSLLESKGSFGDSKDIRADLKAKTETYFAIEKGEAFSMAVVSDSGSIPKGSIAVMRINGIIQKESDMCVKGLDEYQNELESLGSNGNVKGVSIEIHSPGGTAIGWDVFGQSIADFEKKYNKPLAVVINSMAASAAYGIASQAPKIFVASNTSEAGSIGTMATLYDDMEYLQQAGLKEIVVRATKSFNKNEPYYQAVQGNPIPLQKEVLDPLNEAFINSIKSARRGKLDLKTMVKSDTGESVPEIFTGKVYFGNEIVNVGLADAMGGREEAFKYIENKAKEFKKQNLKQQTKQIMVNTKDKTIDELTALKADIEAKVKEGAEAAEFEIQIEMIEREIAYRNLQTESETIKAELEASKLNAEKLAESEKNLEELKAKVSELEASEKTVSEQSSKIAELEASIKEMQDKQAEDMEAFEAAKLDHEKMKTFVSEQFGETKTIAILQGEKPTDGGQPKAHAPKKEMTKEEELAMIKKMAKEQHELSKKK